MNNRPAVPLFGMNIDALTMCENVDAVARLGARARDQTCRYVVTPNVDHAVMFQTQREAAAAYEGAALVLADGAARRARLALAGPAPARARCRQRPGTGAVQARL